MQIQPQLQTQMQEEDPVEVKPKKQNAFKLRPQAQTQTSASGSGEESGNTDIQNKEKRTLEIVNVSAMIDLFAEQQALQEFDQEMHAHTQK